MMKDIVKNDVHGYITRNLRKVQVDSFLKRIDKHMTVDRLAVWILGRKSLSGFLW